VACAMVPSLTCACAASMTVNSCSLPARALPDLPGIGLGRRSRPQRPAAVDVEDLL